MKALRRYDCALYDECLTEAARRFLSCLPCDGCDRYESGPPSMLDEFEGIVELLQSVFWDQGMKIFD